MSRWFTVCILWFALATEAAQTFTYKRVGETEIKADVYPQKAKGPHPVAVWYPFCPIQNVNKDFPSTLFLHGTADPDVPHSQSVEMKTALDKLKVKTEMILIEKGGHDLWGGDRKLTEKAFQRSMEYIREALTQP